MIATFQKKEGREKRKVEAKVAASKQKKTTVKRAKKEKKPFKTQHYYPPKEMIGYKGLDKGKTHTQIMRERETERKEKEKLEQLYIYY